MMVKEGLHGLVRMYVRSILRIYQVCMYMAAASRDDDDGPPAFWSTAVEN